MNKETALNVATMTLITLIIGALVFTGTISAYDGIIYWLGASTGSMIDFHKNQKPKTSKQQIKQGLGMDSMQDTWVRMAS